MPKAIVLLVFVFVSSLVFSQSGTPISSSSNSIKGSIQNNQKFQPGDNGLVDVIVEFNDTPILNYLKNSIGLKSATSFKKLADNYMDKANLFVKDLEQLNKNSNGVSFIPRIKKTYSKIFNGISIEVPPSVITLLKNLSSVKDVYPNTKMEVSTQNISNFVGAERVWQNFGNEGDSIVVAIIDTGIDYMHPALEGGFGKGFKVIGGYDLVDNDADPMDDCGHGTLCAGIIAGNSDKLKGIAPKASLMAFKVMSCKDGWVHYGSIIDAIERCVDLDNTGNFKNNVDVVSISISTVIAVEPNDPICRAVDNASSLGVTFCVSSGNNSSYYSIGSPGAAESAITVSACNFESKLPDFNSMGPNISDFSIKPDVVAPGVNILSSNLNGAYNEASGTSIACPVVAGIAALIKKNHKGWTPEEIKSAIVNTARNINENVMAQGAGIVDAYKAYKINTTINPSSLSFGFVEKSDGNWTKEIGAKISNKNAVSQQYKIEVVNQTTGITLTPSKNNFSLSGLEKQDLSFKLEIDNTKLNALPTEPYTYYGHILIKGTIDTLQIPWAVVKSSKLVVKSDTLFSFQLINGDFIKGFATSSYGNTQEIVAPSGTYDLITVFDKIDFLNDNKITRRLVFKENHQLEGFDTIFISKKDAVHQILPKGITEGGKELNTLQNYSINMMLKAPYNHNPNTFIRYSGLNKLYTSDFSERYSMFVSEFQFEPKSDKKIRLINHHPIVGLNDEVILKNDISDYMSQNLNLSIPNVKDRASVYLGALLTFPINDIDQYSCEGGNHEFLMSDNNWEGKFLYTPGYSKDYFYSLNVFSRDEKDKKFFKEYFRINPFILINDSLRVANHVNITSTVFDYFSPNQGTINLGISPIYPNIVFNNSLTQINIKACPTSSFRGALNEDRFFDYANSTYKIKKGNDLIKSGNIIDFTPLDLNLGEYTFEIVNPNYQINGINGSATMVNTMNFNSPSDNVPPFIGSMQIRNSENIPVDQIRLHEKCTLRVSIVDGKTFQAFIRASNSEQWQEITVSETKTIVPSQKFYSMDLTPYIVANLLAYDIRITSLDENDNSIDYKLEPAFIVSSVSSNSQTFVAKDIETIFAYPNPFDKYLIFNYMSECNKEVILNLINASGEIIMKEKYQVAEGENNLSLQTNHLNPGMYFYQLISKNRCHKGKLLLRK